jgi:hypothetical protein
MTFERGQAGSGRPPAGLAQQATILAEATLQVTAPARAGRLFFFLLLTS